MLSLFIKGGENTFVRAFTFQHRIVDAHDLIQRWRTTRAEQQRLVVSLADQIAPIVPVSDSFRLVMKKHTKWRHLKKEDADDERGQAAPHGGAAVRLVPGFCAL